MVEKEAERTGKGEKAGEGEGRSLTEKGKEKVRGRWAGRGGRGGRGVKRIENTSQQDIRVLE